MYFILCFLAKNTFEVPTKLSGNSFLSMPSISSCQALEYLLLRPKSANFKSIPDDFINDIFSYSFSRPIAKLLGLWWK